MSRYTGLFFYVCGYFMSYLSTWNWYFVSSGIWHSKLRYVKTFTNLLFKNIVLGRVFNKILKSVYNIYICVSYNSICNIILHKFFASLSRISNISLIVNFVKLSSDLIHRLIIIFNIIFCFRRKKKALSSSTKWIRNYDGCLFIYYKI